MNHILFSGIGKPLSIIFTVAILMFASSQIQYSYAASLTTPVEFGIYEISYRDITNLDPTPEPVISLDKSIYHRGDVATLTIIDFNGNVDVNGIDTISALVNSSPVLLEETDINTAIFVGNFIVDGSIEVVYEPDPPEAARASVTIDIQSAGDVILSDFIISDEEAASMFFKPVTHGLDVEFANGAEQSAENIVVKMSFANAIFDFEEELLGTQMYYRNLDNGIDWTAITANFDCENGSINCDELTVTSDPENAGVFDQITYGQFVLGVDTGGAGGGGGGLIRPGLVLNLLAGLNLGGSGQDVYAPSLHFGDSSPEDGFSGILVTDDNINSFPLVINGKGYYLPAFSTTIEPVQVTTGQDVDLILTFIESTGVEHVALHFVDENNDEISESDPMIIFDKGTVTKSDPDGILSDNITFSSSKDGNKYSFNFGFSFDQPGNRHLMIVTWDPKDNQGTTKVFDAFAASGEPIPDYGTNHMIYLDLGAYFITPNGIMAVGEKPDVVQPVIEYDYPDSVGKMERHDGIIYDIIANEKARANQVMSDKFNLDTEKFVTNDQVKPFDPTRRAAELSSPYVGHKIRDFTLSPEENGKLIKELSWKEHLKAQKILDSMLVSSKYHK
ncbi:MAG TPA: hypothetical protein VD699_04550 [Nitrosopumilaceae archaeon]|nr:hypothetical protein [Nitrosopumilaceae archaeon]